MTSTPRRSGPAARGRGQPVWDRLPKRIALVGVLFALIGSIPGRTQGARSAQGPFYRIAGQVVNSATGEPIPRATVSILSDNGYHLVSSVYSDGDGNFVLDRLPPGKYPLSASKRGFRAAFYDEHEEFNSAIVTGEGQDTEHLKFQLTPGAVLSGTVTGDGGDPVDGASVMLFKRPDPSRSGERVAQSGSTVTDDTGAYEFSDLPGGEYLVAVKATPWYALHGQANRGPNQNGTNLDVAYPVTFFDSTTEDASAAPIVLEPGGREEANISLHAVPALHLKLTGGAVRGAPAVELRQTVFGVQITSRGADLVTVQKGTIELSGVAPGNYELTHGNPPRTVEVSASSDLEIEPSSGVPSVSVAGRLRTPEGLTLKEDRATVQLEPAGDAPGRSPLQTMLREGQFRFDSVPPGSWRLSILGANTSENLPVIEVSLGATGTPGNVIAVADKALNVVATVSPAQTRIQGFARMEGKPAPGVMVVLVPREPGAYGALVRRDQSDSDGSFSLRDVPPGRYTVVAIKDGWKLDWRRYEAIARFLPAGVSVMVTGGSGEVLKMTESVMAAAP